MFKKNLINAAIVLSIGFTASAHAFSVNTGSGIINNVGGFDWASGSALSVDSLPLPPVDPNNPSDKGKAFTVFSQGALSSYFATGNGTISDGNLNKSYELTYVLGFGELGQITSVPGLDIATGSFTFDKANPVNFFEIYYDSNSATFANALAGTGYSDGDLILSGIVVNDDSANGGSTITAGNYTISFAAPGLLDQNGADNWAGQQTFTGGGSNTAVIDPQDKNQDFNFFTDLSIDQMFELTIFNSVANTPFTTTDPSNLVAGRTPNIGTINGDPSCDGALGNNGSCDFLFANDAKQKLTVPEPSTLASLGLGLLSAGMSRA